MQKMIWIPDDLIDEIKEEAVKERKSVSSYLVGLFRSRPRIDFGIQPKEKYGESPVETVGMELKTLFNEKPIKEQIKSAPKYSEEYRKKNPSESCKVCGKALRFNCGH